MDCPLISIVLCTYNGAKYLDAQMQSLLNQTYQNIEIIISDDCSTDGTLELLQKYTENSSVHLHINSENIGYSKNFEKALLLAFKPI